MTTTMITSSSVSSLLLVLLVAAAPGVYSGNILIYPYGHCLNSHLLNAEKLTSTLLEHGHHVSFLISDMYDRFEHHDHQPRVSGPGLSMLRFAAPTNYKPICEYDTVDFMMNSPLQERFDAFVETSVKYCESLLAHQELLKSIKERNYDVFIMEALDPCSRILADYLQIPFIPLMTAGLGHWDGNPRLPSYLPAAIAPFTNNMGFGQRVGNFIMKMMYDNIPAIMGFDAPFEALKTKYKMATSLSLSTTFTRAAVKLINSDFSIEYSAPIHPDSIMVGGFSLHEPKPLSAELEAFMTSAGEAGVIVMSTGTLVTHFDERWTQLFTGVFAQLPQKVIWRYRSGSANESSVPDNVKLVKWMPQLDLLAHAQTRLFITHCGLNALFEAVHTATPVVAVPMSGDQMNNAAKLTEHANMGVTVDMFSVTHDTLLAGINTVLRDNQYSHNAHVTSKRFRDQPMSRADKMNYWVDYVIRHKGADHLKSSSHHLSFTEYYCIDVIVTIISVLLILGSLLISALVFIGWTFRNRCFGKSKLD